MIEYKFQFLDKDPKEMTIEELRTEVRCQKALRVPLESCIWHFRKAAYLHNQKLETEKESRIGWRNGMIRQCEEKIAFADNLLIAVKARTEYFQDLLEDKYRHRNRVMQRRQAKPHRPKYSMPKNVTENAKIEAVRRYNKHLYDMRTSDMFINPYGWDKEKLIKIANDRGYMTEDAITMALARVANMPWKTAKAIMENGRLSWGRVLVLGAFFEMTPKEFVDTFMPGYFEEVTPGNFRANQDHVDEMLEYLTPVEKFLFGREESKQDEDKE